METKKMRGSTVIFLVTLLLILDGCSNTRFLPEGQLLYTGQKQMEIITEQEGENSSAMRRQLKTNAPQKPNNSMFDRRVLPPIGLWVYNFWEPDPEKKFSNWLYAALSSPPVLVSDVNPVLRSRKMENELFDQGYFQARVWPVVDTSARNPRKARVSYVVDVGFPYYYSQVEFDPLLESIDPRVSQEDFRAQIKPGDQFNLEKLAQARNNLARQFQDQGYFYFNQNHLELDADTTLGNKLMNLYVRPPREIPKAVLSKYRIDQIHVYLSSPLDSLGPNREPTIFEDLTIFTSGDFLDPWILRSALHFRCGDQYSRDAYQRSVSRLNKLGVFSYVRISYEASKADSSVSLLNVRVDLTMDEPIHLDLESDLVVKSTGFVGPGLSLGISHGNAFRGAEKVQVELKGGIEWQWGPKQEAQLGSFAYELGVNSGLTLPRIYLPGGHSTFKNLVNQETSVHLNFNVLNRTAYYSMFSALTSLNYTWGKRQEIRHSFSPVYLNSVSLLATTPAFDSVVNENIYIRKSFEEQFILGLRYDFSYDNTHRTQAQNVYFQAGVSSSGNVLDLLTRVGKEDEERPYPFLNSIYAQHLKLTSDLRYYLNGYNKTLALRMYAGVGMPYLNSSVLPYVEQFFSGGAYSIRGFTARTLGPGSYYEQESSYIDQSGDMKLEANLEFRFGLSKIVKGALFLETGNIWLINEDENRPGSQFNLDTFYEQLAVGTGIGLRFDFNFFVLRTDLGFPLRTPYLQNNKYWFSQDGNLLSNALFYFAIGYPF